MRRCHDVSRAVRGACVVVTAALAVSWVAGAIHAGSATGPIAISMKSASEALVLQSDGRVLSMDTSTRSVVEHYRVPLRYQPMDLAAVGYEGGPEFCMTINARGGVGGSFLLQIMPDKREVWTHLAAVGLFVGVAVDAQQRVAYVTKPFENAVFRVPLGEEKATPTEVATFPLADRIGPAALDDAGQRLFVADMDGSHVFVVTLATRAVRRVPLSKVSEIRGLAWNSASGLLYIADAGREAIWSIDVTRNNRQSQVFKDKRFGDPAGLAIAPDRTMWLVDEVARAAFQLALNERRILATVPLALKAPS